MQTVTVSPVTGNVSQLSSQDFARIARRIMKDHGVDEERAAAMLHGALDFLTMCSKHRGQQLTPSRPVDDAWHTFLLYSRAYAGFCKSLGTRLWHEPNDGPEPHVGGYVKTLKLMDETGVVYDTTIWSAAGLGGDSVPDPSTCGSDE